MKNKWEWVGKLKRYRAFIGVTALAIFTASLVGFLSSRNSLFRLSEFQILQADKSLETQVNQQLLPYLGQRLTTLSLTDIERRLQEIPRVRRVSIRKKWPSSLQVVVEEKKAVALSFIRKKLWRLDEYAQPIDVLRAAQALPLIKNYRRDDPDIARVCEWLAQQPLNLSLESLEWRADRGLVVENWSQNFVAELGFDGFQDAWQRVEAARSYLASKNLPPKFLDASYGHRVVVRLNEKLQNFENELNLKELVQRADASEAAAR